MTAMKAGRPSTHEGVRCACWCGGAYSYIAPRAVGVSTFVCGADRCSPPDGIDPVPITPGASVQRENDGDPLRDGCIQCGSAVPRSHGRGRPRKRCDDCHVAVYGPASLKYLGAA